MKPQRVQRKRVKGWKMPPNTVYVGRGSRWGNPYRVDGPVCRDTLRKWEWRFDNPDYACQDVLDAVRRFAACLGLDSCMIAEVRKHLKGKHLACFCPLDQPCHADVLLDIANGGTT